jgi:hypothetical protein
MGDLALTLQFVDAFSGEILRPRWSTGVSSFQML